ncbi:ORF155 [White spot syndrome virus]|uniref:ORF155 n=1 Tax=White spot syndrome virus TaxID=342409 RepID=A0A2D3I6F5_9VIRU|nr:ORF155 [White spot syndrome virus]
MDKKIWIWMTHLVLLILSLSLSPVYHHLTPYLSLTPSHLYLPPPHLTHHLYIPPPPYSLAPVSTPCSCRANP